eukprot:1160513-Pelagomonas_calceolata.AAC.3
MHAVHSSRPCTQCSAYSAQHTVLSIECAAVGNASPALGVPACREGAFLFVTDDCLEPMVCGMEDRIYASPVAPPLNRT